MATGNSVTLVGNVDCTSLGYSATGVSALARSAKVPAW